MENQNKSNPREKIAKIISYSVPIATLLIGIVAVFFAMKLIDGESEEGENNTAAAIDILKYTFAALLPLWGTWLGTVLAYYFSKENFESANDSVRKLVDQVTTVKEKLQSIKATEVMVPFEKMDYIPNISTEDELKNIKVTDAIDFLEKKQKNRLPVIVGKSLKYIIHLSTFDRFVRIKNGDTDLTLPDMLSSLNDVIKNSLTNGAKFISSEASLFEAKQLMDKDQYCNDVFITKNGLPEEPVIGWITDKIINENAKV